MQYVMLCYALKRFFNELYNLLCIDRFNLHLFFLATSVVLHIIMCDVHVCA